VVLEVGDFLDFYSLTFWSPVFLKGGENEKTLHGFTFGSDSMLHGRLPGQSSDGRA
jgi:hypothetical protein